MVLCVHVHEHRVTHARLEGSPRVEAASSAQCVSPGRRLSKITTLYPRQPPGPAVGNPPHLYVSVCVCLYTQVCVYIYIIAWDEG